MVQVMLINQEFLFQKAFHRMMDDMREYHLIGVAETGIQAMDMMNAYRPGIIFADAILGLENGIQLCKKIKEKFPETIIYILSNYCNFNLMKESMYAGIEDFILKPLSRLQLESLLKESQNGKITEKDREEKEREEKDMIEEELFSAIDDKDYKRACISSDKLIDYIYSSTDGTNRKEKLESIVSHLFYVLPMMDQTQKNHYIQKYRLTSKILNKKGLCQFWMIQIVTEIFRQLCIVKYTHMNRAFQYIENNLKEEISLTELSEQAGISNGYLSRIFKKYYHISVVDYIHLRKLHMAKYYMIVSEMNISDISFMMGYSEAGYFCKIFKKYEGMTPSAYLSLIAKEKDG